MVLVQSTKYLEGPEFWLARLGGRPAGGSVHPAELASRISAESDVASRLAAGGMVAPNRFVVRLSRGDLEALPDHRGLIHNLEAMTDAMSMSRGRRLEGPVRVWLEPDPAATPGTVQVDAFHRIGRRPAWALLIGDGQLLELRVNRSVLGRDRSADVAIPHPSVSRRHALIWHEGEGVWIRDLDSARGTMVDGRPTLGTTRVRPPATVTLGSVSYEVQVL